MDGAVHEITCQILSELSLIVSWVASFGVKLQLFSFFAANLVTLKFSHKKHRNDKSLLVPEKTGIGSPFCHDVVSDSTEKQKQKCFWEATIFLQGFSSFAFMHCF